MNPEALLSRIEAVVATRFSTQVKRSRTKNGLELRICCPFCPSKGKTIDRNYKLWINPVKNMWRCWRCDSKGSVQRLIGQSYTLPVFNWKAQAKPRVIEKCDVSPGELVRLDHLDDDHLGVQYLERRGFSAKAAGKYFGVSFCTYGRPFGGESFKFDTSNTIVFPVWMAGKLAGWQARLLYNPDELEDAQCEMFGFLRDADKGWLRPPKYFTSPGLTKGDVLYNYDVAKKSSIVVVTEGPTDVLAAGPCAVGTLGKGITDTQVSLLGSHWDVVVVLLDPDAMKEATWVNSQLQKTKAKSVMVTLDGYKDPGDAPTKEIWRQINHQLSANNIDLSSINMGPYWCEEILRR